MPTPPFPIIPAVLLAAAIRLGWRVVTRDPTSGVALGELVEGGRARHLIVVAGSAPGTVEWALVDEVPRGFAAHLLTSATHATRRRRALQRMVPTGSCSGAQPGPDTHGHAL